MTDAPVLVPRDAATVMLVRDGDDGIEVFMLRRHLNSAFLGGAFVFPGGAVDDHDRHADLDAVCVGRRDAAASDLLGLDPPVGGLAFWVAAVREAFEEAGVLLAYDANGSIIDWTDPAVAERFAEHRKAVDAGERRLVDICVEERLQLAVDSMHYFSHWITPVGPPRRFDTRFFVAKAPEGHTYLHDDRETIAATWVRPADAIERQERGEVDIIFPTLRSLDAIGRFDTTDALLAAAAAIEHVPTMLPRAVKDHDGIRILLPGDPGYDSFPVSDLVPGVPRAISPMVRRILAPNPGVFTGPGTNTYLVGIDEVVVVDPGPDLGEDTSHLDAVVACGSDRIRWIVCTHTHPDHSPATAALKERTGAEVLAFGSNENLTVDREIGDGFQLEGTEFVLTALHTPGHASNHLCYVLEGEQLLFSGDHIMNGSTVVIGPPDGDMATYIDQLERLNTVRLRAIAPGHGEVIEDPKAKVDEYLTHRRAREAKVIDVLRVRGNGTVKVVTAVYDDVPTERHWIAESSLWAHLRKLADEGTVTSTDADSVESSWTFV